MQRFSFDFADPVFEISGWRLSLQVTTFENTYGLDAERRSVRREGDGWAAEAEGWAWLRASPTDKGIEVVAGAEMSQRVRSLKVIVRGLEAENLIGRNWEAWPFPAHGRVLRYPGFLDTPPFIHTPLVFLEKGGEHTYFESLDGRVRAKRFAFYAQDGEAVAELVHEEAAHEMSVRIETPPWRIGRTRDPEAVVREHTAHVERAHGLRPWEEREDVPGWAREISLVVTLHGMHWTGYTFNTYAQMLAALEWVCERIEGKRVLAFLPGWEGRYYWQYGDYRPEPRLGGPEGFRALAEGTRRLGATLMPMFGANCANTNLPGYERWGAPAALKSPTGIVFQGNRPDWDASRSNDPGWQAWLNPGHPAWRSHLVEQVSAVLGEYGLRAVFFDTHHIWENDPDYPLYEGLVALRDELRSRFPDLLVTGEGWYDALGAVTPVSHVGTPTQWPEFFGRYNRTFAHLMFGDPSRGSSGVHEAGYTGFIQVPEARHWWPTLVVVDGTLERAPEKAEEVIGAALRYAERWLG